MRFSAWTDLGFEYALGFGFGWAFSQAFAMRDMAGGSYLRSLKLTFLPEFLSMNLLMAGMVAAAKLLMRSFTESDDPTRPEFWFVMSMALIVGFVLAYPMNWWLVANGLKHGMFTVRKEQELAGIEHGATHMARDKHARNPSPLATLGITALSIIVLAFGIAVSRVV